MKKTLFLSSLLLIALSTNACVKKNVNLPTSPQVFEQAVAPVSHSSTPHTPTPIVSTGGESHQLKTIQGSMIFVQERSNGFVFPQYQGKIVLLQVFGQDCPYCFREMPIINNIKRKYFQNLEIIALQAQEPMSQDVASNLIQKFQMNYPIIDKDEARSLLYLMNSTYGWNGILPYMLLIKDGVTEYSFSGEVSQQELDEAVRSLI